MIYLGVMANIIALLFGLLGLVFTFPGTIPLLGWLNWIGLPIALIGVLIGHMSSGQGKWGPQHLHRDCGMGGIPPVHRWRHHII